MVTIGFLGCANVHTPWILKVITERKDVRIKAVYDHDSARAARLTNGINCILVPDPRMILADPEIDGVFICSENNRKAEDIIAVAHAGKAVFVEKPMAFSSDDVLKAADAVEKAGVLFMTGYRTRSEGIFIFLREEIRKGHFGRLTRIRYINCLNGMSTKPVASEIQWMWDVSQSGGGWFLDLGTHALDSIMWLAGEPVVAATATIGRVGFRPELPDNDEFGEGLVRFESGAIGSMAGANTDIDQPVRCVISGTKGHAYVANQQLYYKSSCVPEADGKTPWLHVPKDRPLVFDIFLDALAKKANGDFITAREAAHVCCVQEAMYLGNREARWVKPAYCS